ncbi:MAG TPA: hypothetical protein ENG40_00660 [Thermoprotei archaeon]|nr:MAG: hypothetical protein DRJ34_00490 [Thermoprotei archaeon]HDJ89191.1 hypothetical protein [Thermoprotei archaeon]
MEDVISMINEILDNILIDYSEKLKEIKRKYIEMVQEEIESRGNQIIEEYLLKIRELEKRLNDLRNTRNLIERRERTKIYNEIIEKVFENALSKISKFVRDENYAKVLEKLFLEGLNIVESKNVYVDISENDSEIFQKILPALEKKCDVKIVVKNRIKSVGGLIIYNPDRTIVIDNTFETRLDKIKDKLRPMVYRILFKGCK